MKPENTTEAWQTVCRAVTDNDLDESVEEAVSYLKQEMEALRRDGVHLLALYEQVEIREKQAVETQAAVQREGNGSRSNIQNVARIGGLASGYREVLRMLKDIV